MVTITSTRESELAKNFFKTMANGLLAVNISGSPAVGTRWKAAKKHIFLLRSQPMNSSR